jgi:hypothetical protein
MIPRPLNRCVEAKFELGQNAAKTLHKGDAVFVVGHERDASFEGTPAARRSQSLCTTSPNNLLVNFPPTSINTLQ